MIVIRIDGKDWPVLTHFGYGRVILGEGQERVLYNLLSKQIELKYRV